MTAANERIGQVLGGKYRVQQVLATGGMGFVYAAQHQVTGRAVAVKLLRPELVTRPDLVERVRQEARLAVEASHPNVVEVLDAGADDAGVPYLVLERLYGQPLDALLERPLSLRCTLEALLPVCNALTALHQIGIVHRDLKPSNIFLSRAEGGRVVPKLLDFGIAKALEGSGSTMTGATLGTPAYMAPEQVLCNVASPASDVWSLAVVFVRCLTGRLPFADVAQRGLQAFGNQRPLQLDGVAEPIARVLTAALRFEACERPASAGMFRIQLLAALREVNAAASEPDASNVGFAANSALGLALNAVASPVDAAVSPSPPALARPREVLTQTLSRAWQSAWVRRPRWHRALALLVAAFGLLLLADGRWAARLRPRAAVPPPMPVPMDVAVAGPLEPMVSTVAARTESALSTPPELADVPPAVKAESAPRTVGKRHRTARKHRRERAARVSAAVPAAAAAPPPAVAEVKRPTPVLGANRSPIIE